MPLLRLLFLSPVKLQNQYLHFTMLQQASLPLVGHIDFFLFLLQKENMIFKKPLTFCTSEEYGLANHTFDPFDVLNIVGI